MIVGSFIMSGSYPLKWVAFNLEPPVVIKLEAFRNIFYTKVVMNSAQYHEEKIFVQAKNPVDKILPFHRQLSNIAWLSVIRLV